MMRRPRFIPFALACLLSVGAAHAGDMTMVAEKLPPLPKGHAASMDAEFHFAAVAMSDDDAPVTVRLADGPRPVVLVLMSLTSVEWRFSGARERLRAVVVVGDGVAGRSLLAELPEGVAAYRLSQDLSEGQRRADWSEGAPITKGGQRLDPSFRISARDVAAAGVAATGYSDGFASLSIGWRSRVLDVPGRNKAEISVRELHDIVADIAAHPEARGVSPLRDRLAKLGDAPGLVWRGATHHELHSVHLEACAASQPSPQQQHVLVPPTGRPIILALHTDCDMEWVVEVEYGAQLTGVVLLGTIVPLRLTLPADVPVTLAVNDLVPGANDWAALADPGENGAWQRLQRGRLHLEQYRVTGKALTLR